ncbi:hypothetical protein NDU88_005261 [Pleurodeles waltl]|uniref:Uncharacterized protein n=1 Tax=Pleurodeles waltl TaxID=8319 RepID=A0AAV7RLL5_PLEWA|nr:hypothetical protein NDU88_005261 [Pleurodeles waltl]
MKTPLFGGAEHRRSRNQQKSLKKIADPGELCKKSRHASGEAWPLQVRGAEQGEAGGRREVKERAGKTKGHCTGSTGRKGGEIVGRDPRRKKTQKKREREKDKDSGKTYMHTNI